MSVFVTKIIEELTGMLIDYRGKTPPKSDNGIRLITAKVIKEGRILDEKHEYISEETYKTWMHRGFPEKGDVLITTEAPLGEVAQLKTSDKIALAQRVILLRGKPELINQRFYYYSLQSPYAQAELKARATGTTVFGIKQSELRKVRIPYFRLDIQNKISSILSAYDDLIENNLKRIKILEEMAQMIYREWFVNFRFPGHEKGKMVKSEMGLIPEGWEIKKLIDVCKSLEDGDWIETKDQGGNDYRLIQVSNIGVDEFIETGNFRYISEDTYKRLKCNEVKEEDILISRMPKPIAKAYRKGLVGQK
jgi:type I restriction enzyme S subunit